MQHPLHYSLAVALPTNPLLLPLTTLDSVLDKLCGSMDDTEGGGRLSHIAPGALTAISITSVTLPIVSVEVSVNCSEAESAKGLKSVWAGDVRYSLTIHAFLYSNLSRTSWSPDNSLPEHAMPSISTACYSIL